MVGVTVSHSASGSLLQPDSASRWLIGPLCCSLLAWWADLDEGEEVRLISDGVLVTVFHFTGHRLHYPNELYRIAVGIPPRYRNFTQAGLGT